MKFALKKVLSLTAAVMALSFAFGSASTFAAEAGKYYFDLDYNKSAVSGIPSDAATVVVVPSKDQLSEGEEFYVDFIVKNNPGICSFSIKILYDGSVLEPIMGDENAMDAVAEVTYRGSRYDNLAITAAEINDAIKKKSDNYCFRAGFFMGSANQLAAAENDGILFRMNFKALKAGKSNIEFEGYPNMIFGNTDNEVIPVYVSNASVTVGNAAKNNEVSKITTETQKVTEKVTEATTESTSETTEKETAAEVKDGGIKINVPKDMSSARQFTDIDSVPWAKNSIDVLSSLGIINGVSDVNFNPKAYTTRGDFTLVMSRLLGLEGQASVGFADVDASKYYANAIGLTKELGISNGVDANRFMPEANISRQDVMVIVSRTLDKIGVLKKGDVSLLNSFSDNGYVSPYARQAMADLIEMGIIKGDGGMLKPANNITRAEMAVVMKNVYDIIVK